MWWAGSVWGEAAPSPQYPTGTQYTVPPVPSKYPQYGGQGAVHHHHHAPSGGGYHHQGGYTPYQPQDPLTSHHHHHMTQQYGTTTQQPAWTYPQAYTNAYSTV